MEKTPPLKVSKLLLSGLFCFCVITGNAQMTVHYASKNNQLYLQEVNNNVVTNLDTLTLLNMFEEYSFHLDSNKLYVAWSVNSFEDKTYYINSYLISQTKQLELNNQEWISFKEYPKFKEKKMTFSLNDNGLYFKFFDSNVNLVVLSYSELRKNRFNKIVSKISKL